MPGDALETTRPERGWRFLAPAFVLLASVAGFAAALPGGASASADPERAEGPLWDRRTDRAASYRFYPVAEGSWRGCLHRGQEATDPRFAEVCHAADDVYRRRVHFMNAGMNLPDDAERLPYCDRMADLLSDGFTHIQAPMDKLADGRGGWSFVGKAGLLRACHDRAFNVSGFYAECRRVTVIDENRGVATTAYVHDQVGGLAVPTGHFHPATGRPLTFRVSVESVSRAGPGQPWRIDTHNAHDVPPSTVHRACKTG